MGNVQSVAHCVKCGVRGYVKKMKGAILTLECPECNGTWNTLSAMCPECKKPNGYPGPGPCQKCYSARVVLS